MDMDMTGQDRTWQNRACVGQAGSWWESPRSFAYLSEQQAIPLDPKRAWRHERTATAISSSRTGARGRVPIWRGHVSFGGTGLLD
jgi:hypothetical protein